MAKTRVTIMITSLLIFAACSQGTDKSGNQGMTAEATGSTTTQAEELAPAAGEGRRVGLFQPTRDQINRALDAYETIREKLAADTTSGLAEVAGKLQTEATAAAASAPEEISKRMQKISELSAKVGSESARGLGEARAAFAGLSREVVALLAEQPMFAEGRHLFECPMAPAYKKWVQKGETIENPYMGKAMLACGVKSKYEESDQN